MVTLFVRHKVADFDTWKKGYDEAAPFQKEGGVLEESVYRDTDDDSMVIVTHKFRDVDTAKKFANNEQLKAKMQEIGVQGPPTFWYGEEV